MVRRSAGERLLLVGSYRHTEVSDDHPLSRSLASLRADGLVSELILAGLHRDEVGQLIELIVEQKVDFDVATYLHQETGGNPLFVIELARSLREEGKLGESLSTGGGLALLPGAGLPRSIREVVTRRVSRLGPGCARVLRTASVLGHQFELGTLALVAGTGGGALAEDLDRAVGAGLITETPGLGRPEFAFAHPIIRDAVYQQLGRAGRASVHARAAEILESYYGDDVDVHAAEIAHHLVRAGSLADEHKAIDYSWKAGCRAISLCAYDEAVLHLRNALRCLEEHPDRRSLRPGLVTEMGFALGQLGNLEEALRHYGAALRLHDQAGEVRMAANVRRKMGVLLNTYGRFAEAAPLLEQALQGFGEEVSVDHCSGLSAYAIALVGTARLGAGEPFARRAVEMARHLNDARAEASGEQAAGAVSFWNFGEPERAPANFLRAFDLFVEAGSLDAGSRCQCDAALSLYLSGRVSEAYSALDEGETYANRYNRSTLADVYALRVLVAVHRGDWRAAHDAWEAYLGVAGPAGFSPYDAAAKRARTLQLLWRGDMASARQTLATNSAPYNLPLAAWLSMHEGRGEDALAQTTLIASSLPTQGRGGLWVVLALPVIVAERECGSPDRGRWFDRLLSHSGWLPDWFLPDVELGWLALEAGRRDWPAFFEKSIEQTSSFGLAPLAAITRFEFGKALLAGRKPQDKIRALDELGEGQAVFERLGMTWYLNQVRPILQAGKLGRPPEATAAFGLTPRELEVLQLAAAGRTNSEIAAALQISRKTVERHISNILVKTDAADRTQAAVMASQAGLIKPSS
jgi:DNA-binding CsgD family transcriptional regulator/tetratricopeptide (TPR) repeat protein